VETIVSMVIIAVAIAGLVPVFGLVKSSADPMLEKQALSAASALLEEVRSAAFTWCDKADPAYETAASAAACAIPEVLGPEAGNTRPYDNANDYHAWCTTPMSPITDITGTTVAGLSGFTAKVCVSTAALGSLPDTGDVRTAAVLRISVTVSGANASVTLDGWKVRNAPNS
jgi:MSHA pilin protein MshD